jgi:PAS domain S-box-containing protein
MLNRKYKIIIICTSLGLVAWVADNIFDYYFFHKPQSFFDLIIFDITAHETFMRTIILALFVGFGFYINHFIDKIEEVQKVLREREGQFYQVAANIRHVFWFYKADFSQVIYVSPAYERIWGRTLKDLYKNSKDRVEAIHPEDRAEVVVQVEKAIAGQKSFLMEYRLLQPDGTMLWISDQGFPIRNHQGEVCYLGGFAEDITVRKRGEEALRKAKDELEKRVAERTSDLTAAYQKLLHETEERRRAEQAVQDAAERVRTLTFQIVNAEESERRRISVTLHDELGQDLIYLKYQIIKKSQKDNNFKNDWEDLLQKLDGIIGKVRQLSHYLSPTILEELGLTAGIRFLFEEFCQHHECACVISSESDKVCELSSNPHACHFLEPEGIDGLLSHQAEVNVYRILQESLNNISRHSEASRVVMAIKKQDDHILFEVADNGKGFDVQKAMAIGSAQKGIGIVSIQERVRMLGGSFNIESQEGSGTKICFLIPIDK